MTYFYSGDLSKTQWTLKVIIYQKQKKLRNFNHEKIITHSIINIFKIFIDIIILYNIDIINIIYYNINILINIKYFKII